MFFYLKWSPSSGDKATNNETLQISGIVGSLVSVQYTVKTDAQSYSENRYIFDIRRQIGATANGGGVGYILEFEPGNYNTNGISNFSKNGTSFSNSGGFFTDYVADDVFKFDVNATPSSGAIAFGARYNEVEHNYGFAVSEIIITDANGAHTINMSDSGGTGASLTSTDGALTATLFNFPTDDSQWVSYAPAPKVAPLNVSGSLSGGDALLSWNAVPDADKYNFEFRRKP